MSKLHEIIAVASGKKGEVEKQVGEVYKLIQKPELFDGIQKSYRPLSEDGERLPAERKNIQIRTKEVVDVVQELWAGLFDVTFTLDCGNQLAKGDIIVGEKTLATDVPVPTLLFLEKQLKDVKSFIEKLPTPDPSEDWMWDVNSACMRTPAAETARTKKTQRAIVKYPATEQHPAQTEMVTEDVLAGYWTTVKQTAKMTGDDKVAALKRVTLLLDAVKTARERANGIEVEQKKIGDSILSYVFGGK